MMSRPLRVCIVGAGPAGMYAAHHLLEQPGGTYLNGKLTQLSNRDIEVDMLDRLITPWGLLRYGVAPDHPEKKMVQTVFEAVAARSGFRYFGNIEVGRDVHPHELREWYDAVIYAIGCSGDTRLGIVGEELNGCWSAREFVAWYNGHPDYSELPINLKTQRAVIIGNGNVAMDIARILSTDPNILASTDISNCALAALRTSEIREVVVIGRRDYQQSAFNNPELEELGAIEGVDIIVSREEIKDEHRTDHTDPAIHRKIATLKNYAERLQSGHERRIKLQFLTTPLEVLGTQSVEGIRVMRNRLESALDGHLSIKPGQESVIETGLIFRAIGYFGVKLDGLPFDEHRGVIPSELGRVQLAGVSVAGSYVTGWIKRGPRGILGTNKKCARDTVISLLEDADEGLLHLSATLDANTIEALLRERKADIVDLGGWKRLDDKERRLGRLVGRPRIKQLTLDEQLKYT
jgi:ferredoxin--NADP+ reductase